MISQILFLLLLLAIYYLVIKPWRLFNWYYKHLTDLGYKVYTNGFNIIGGSTFDNTKDAIVHKDPNYSLKHKYFQYDIVLDHFFNNIIISSINPDLIASYCTMDKLYVTAKSQKLFAGAFKQTLGDSIVFSSNVETWKKKRKIMTQIFNFQFIKSVLPQFVHTTYTFFQRLEKSSQYPNINLQKQMVKLIGQIGLQTFLGIKHQQIFIQGQNICWYINKYFDTVNDVLIKPEIGIFGPKIIFWGIRQKYRLIKKMKKNIQNKLKQIIIQRMQTFKNNPQLVKETDFINLLIRHNQRCKDANPKQILSADEMVVEIIAFLVAAIDTTSHTLQNLIYLVSKTPQAYKRLSHQINTYIKSEEDISNPEVLKKLDYFECVMKQTLRHYCILNGIFPREATADHTLNGIKIFKGVIMNFWTVPNYYNPKYFKDPQRFYPQRWQGLGQKQIHPFLMMHFSSGPRSCLGKQMAMLQMKIVTVCLFRKYMFKLEKQNYGYIIGIVFRTQEIKTKVIKLSQIKQ